MFNLLTHWLEASGFKVQERRRVMYTAVIYYVDTSSIKNTPPCQIDKQNRVCFVFFKTLNLSRFPAFSQLCKKNPTLCFNFYCFFFLELVAARQGPSIKDVDVFWPFLIPPSPCRNFNLDLPNLYLLLSCNIEIWALLPLKYSDVFYGWTLRLMHKYLQVHATEPPTWGRP